MKEAPTCKTPAEVLHQAQWENELRHPDEDEDEEEEHFSMLMESLGANSVFEKWAVCMCVCVWSRCSDGIISTESVLGQTSGLRLLSAV